MNTYPRIVLASASPRRQELLKLIVPDFEVVPSDFDEKSMNFSKIPPTHVIQASIAKACAVEKNCPDAIVIAADTIVVVDGKILGKPRDKKEAFKMLKLLSGRAHYVYTGLTVTRRSPQFLCSQFERTEVRFAQLSDETIRKYIATGEPMDKAGAYAIQGKGSVFVEGITGCYFNVVGLPLHRLSKMLKNFGVTLELI